MKRTPPGEGRSIAKDLTFGLIGTVLVVSLISVSLSYYFFRKNAQAQLVGKADEIVSSLTQTLAVPLWNFDDKTIESIGTTYSQQEIISFLDIVDSNDTVFFQFNKENTVSSLERTGTIHYQGEDVGSYSIGFSRDQYATFAVAFLRQSLLLIALNLVALLCIIGFFTKGILESRIQQFSDLIEKFQKNKYQFPDGYVPVREFKVFFSVLSNMADQIKARMEDLERSHDELELRVQERTSDLAKVNEDLKREVVERKQAEKERETLEAQLLQSQKMEAIGTLAGGIAHDFNNILGAILGYAEMAQEEVVKDSTAYQDLEKVVVAGNRAKDLVTQILAFSRQTKSEQRPLQPQPIVKECIKLLRSSIPTTISIEQEIDPACRMIKADPIQLHQVIMNLCTNAFQAMEKEGGSLMVTLERVELRKNDLQDVPSMQPGFYVVLTVKDTGPGIDPVLLKNIFEPYFTTKEVGKGTGMGLAVVHGIVKNHGGFIRLKSKIDKGTSFMVAFPELLEAEEEALVEEQPVPTGNENILLVDDEEFLVDIVTQILTSLGYSVTGVTSSVAALELFNKQPDHFDLIITDQTMPQMTGVALSKEILRCRPQTPILLCTGFSGVVSRKEIRDLGIKGLVMKPMVKKDIAPLIRKVLDER